MRLILAIAWMLCSGLLLLASAESVKLAMKNFQLNFLGAIQEIIDTESTHYVDELLNVFTKKPNHNAYHIVDWNTLKQNKQLDAKIVYAKQLLDVEMKEDITQENFYILRNLNFFKRLKKLMRQFEEESQQELRDLRMFTVCKQFQKATKPPVHSYRPPYARATKLVPLNEQNIGDALEQLDAKANHTISVDLKTFGRTLYENIKLEGSEIIDDYLLTIRKLLQEILDEKSNDGDEQPEESHKIQKVLNEIDSILGVKDFFEKRQKLYAYLENGLQTDHENFRNSEHEIGEIFTKLNERGMNLFVSFLFSNFQFLEHLHEEWAKLLPEAPVGLYDEQTKHLHDIHHHYEQFKVNEERRDKYETYMEHVERLYAKTNGTNVEEGNGQENTVSTAGGAGNTTSQGDGHARVFELLHNASRNLGRVTLNIIRERCDEFFKR